MAFTLADAEQLVMLAGLHDPTSNRIKLHDAIDRAANEFLRRTRLDRRVCTVTCVEDQDHYEITSGGFHSTLMVAAPWVSSALSGRRFQTLRSVSLNNLQGERERFSNTTGQPELIHWINGTQFMVFPTPDAAHVISLPYSRYLTDFIHGIRGQWTTGVTYHAGDVVYGDGTPDTHLYRCLNENQSQEPDGDSIRWKQLSTVWATGATYYAGQYVQGDGTPDALYYRVRQTHTSGAASEPPNPTYFSGPLAVDPYHVEVNIDPPYFYDVMSLGGRAKMLRGMPGVPDSFVDAAARDFERVIRETAGANAGTDGVWYRDNQADLTRNYGPIGLRNT